MRVGDLIAMLYEEFMAQIGDEELSYLLVWAFLEGRL